MTTWSRSHFEVIASHIRVARHALCLELDGVRRAQREEEEEAEDMSESDQTENTLNSTRVIGSIEALDALAGEFADTFGRAKFLSARSF